MKSLARVLLAVIPALMLILAAVLANRDQPRIAGMPFLLGWTALWVLLTPLFLYAADRLRERA